MLQVLEDQRHLFKQAKITRGTQFFHRHIYFILIFFL